MPAPARAKEEYISLYHSGSNAIIIIKPRTIYYIGTVQRYISNEYLYPHEFQSRDHSD